MKRLSKSQKLFRVGIVLAIMAVALVTAVFAAANPDYQTDYGNLKPQVVVLCNAKPNEHKPQTYNLSNKVFNSDLDDAIRDMKVDTDFISSGFSGRTVAMVDDDRDSFIEYYKLVAIDGKDGETYGPHDFVAYGRQALSLHRHVCSVDPGTPTASANCQVPESAEATCSICRYKGTAYRGEKDPNNHASPNDNTGRCDACGQELPSSDEGDTSNIDEEFTPDATVPGGDNTGEGENNSAENNGTENNGTENNGTENNGTENNGTESNGTENNGTENNGTESNGTESNGTESNGTENNGTESNGGGSTDETPAPGPDDNKPSLVPEAIDPDPTVTEPYAMTVGSLSGMYRFDARLSGASAVYSMAVRAVETGSGGEWKMAGSWYFGETDLNVNILPDTVDPNDYGPNTIVIVVECGKGTYNVVHEYYHDSIAPDNREGVSEIESKKAELASEHNDKEVERIIKPTFEPVKGNTYTYVEAVYGNKTGDTTYDMETGKTSAVSTEEGKDIIILRYVRKPGSYKVVHEYYKDKIITDPNDPNYAKNFEGRSEIQTVDNLEIDGTKTYNADGVTKVGTHTCSGNPDTHADCLGKEYTYQYEEGAYGTSSGENSYQVDGSMSSVIATENGEQIIILRYVRSSEAKQGSYKVVHEYYHNSIAPTNLDGVSTISTIGAELDSEHKADGVTKITNPTFNENVKKHTYSYVTAVYGKTTSGTAYDVETGKDSAVSTEDGNEIIILRYVYTPDDPGTTTPPDKPDPKDRPKDPDPPKDPEEPPKEPEEPPKEPEEPPTEPEEPPEEPKLPDPNDPDSPDEITITEDGVPKTYIKVWDPENEEFIYIPDDEVPLWDATPQTNDSSHTALWAGLCAVSLAGMIVLGRKKDDHA